MDVQRVIDSGIPDVAPVLVEYEDEHCRQGT